MVTLKFVDNTFIIIIYKTCKFSYFFPYINILDYVPVGEEVTSSPDGKKLSSSPAGKKWKKKKKKNRG